MKNKSIFSALLIVVFLVAASGVMQADAISGSLPFVLFTASENGTNLATSTTESAVAAITSGSGTGDFSVVAFMSSFGPIALNDLTVGKGGGFSFSNAAYGSFVATSGSIFTQTTNFLDVTLFGTYFPGPGISGVGPAAARVDLSFNQTGNSLSGSFTLATVPEPGTLVLMGSALIGLARVIRCKLTA